MDGLRIENFIDKILFIDARNIFTQIDRAHRTWNDEQINQIASIARSYREEEGCEEYEDIPSLCKSVTSNEIIKSEYSLNPGRYVGLNIEEEDSFNFPEIISGLHSDFMKLKDQTSKIEEQIEKDFDKYFRKIL